LGLTRFCGVEESNIAILITGAEDEGSRPARSNILSKAMDIVSLPGASQLNRVYLFLSGHGVVSPVDGRLYFVCQDTLPALLQDTAIDVGAIIDRLRMLGPSEIVVLLDTCRSTFIQGTKSTAWTNYQPFIPNDRFAAVVYSCAPGSASYESEPARAGVFTEAFLRELGEGGSCTTIDELRDRLPRTMEQVSRAAGKPMQVPFFVVEEATGAQIVLVDRPTLYTRRRASLLTGEIRVSDATRISAPADVEKTYVGLDFGTTKTLAAYPQSGGGVYFVPSPSGSPLLDSLITLKKDLRA
jgi:uncharacterized caspase-like protein